MTCFHPGADTVRVGSVPHPPSMVKQICDVLQGNDVLQISSRILCQQWFPSPDFGVCKKLSQTALSHSPPEGLQRQVLGHPRTHCPSHHATGSQGRRAAKESAPSSVLMCVKKSAQTLSCPAWKFPSRMLASLAACGLSASSFSIGGTAFHTNLRRSQIAGQVYQITC